MSRALLLFNPGWRSVVATNLSNTTMGALTMKQITSAMPICPEAAPSRGAESGAVQEQRAGHLGCQAFG